jgi:hypothetical protein
MSEEKASTKTGTAQTGTTKTETTKSETAKTETTQSETTKSETSKSGGDSGGAGSQNKSASALSISHFSSVRSDEYRSGWEDIFGNGKRKSRAKSLPSKAAPDGPVSVQLGNEDLPAALLRGLEAALRKKAKKDEIKLGRTSKSRQFNWRVTGEISG